MRSKRQGLIIWFKHRKNIRQIRRYGHLIYASKRLKYAMIYVDQEEIEEIEAKLKRHKFVRKTDKSYLPFMKTQFNQPKLEEEKEEMYKIGI